MCDVLATPAKVAKHGLRARVNISASVRYFIRVMHWNTKFDVTISLVTSDGLMICGYVSVATVNKNS